MFIHNGCSCGKNTAKLHTIMDEEYEQISAKGIRTREGLYNTQELILNIYKQ